MSYVDEIGEIGITLCTWNRIELKKSNGFVYTEEEEHVIEWSYRIMGRSFSLYVTILPSFLAIVIMVAEM